MWTDQLNKNSYAVYVSEPRVHPNIWLRAAYIMSILAKAAENLHSGFISHDATVFPQCNSGVLPVLW